MTSNTVSSGRTAIDTSASGQERRVGAGVHDEPAAATRTTITGDDIKADSATATGTTVDRWLRDEQRRWDRIRARHRPRRHHEQRW